MKNTIATMIVEGPGETTLGVIRLQLSRDGLVRFYANDTQDKWLGKYEAMRDALEAVHMEAFHKGQLPMQEPPGEAPDLASMAVDWAKGHGSDQTVLSDWAKGHGDKTAAILNLKIVKKESDASQQEGGEA